MSRGQNRTILALLESIKIVSGIGLSKHLKASARNEQQNPNRQEGTEFQVSATNES